MITDAEKIVRSNLVDVEPDAEYTAAAGRDYGHVEVWQLDDGRYAIKYGNSAASYYYITDDADDIRDLAAWLEWDNLDRPEDYLIQTANVRGPEAIPQASEKDKGPFWILVTHEYYGPISNSDLVYDDDGEVAEFASYKEAQAWIKAEQAAPYVLAHNDAGRPEYKVVVAR